MPHSREIRKSERFSFKTEVVWQSNSDNGNASEREREREREREAVITRDCLLVFEINYKLMQS